MAPSWSSSQAIVTCAAVAPDLSSTARNVSSHGSPEWRPAKHFISMFRAALLAL
jgi:hypothetical protein